MAKKKRPTYSAEFKLETAKLVVDESYSHAEAAQAMNVGNSTISKWVSAQ